MGLKSDLNMSSSSDSSFAAAEKAAHLVSIDSDDPYSQIITQSTQQSEAQTPPQSAIVLQELPETILDQATPPSPRHRPPLARPVSAPRRMENPVPSTSKATSPVSGKNSGKSANKSPAAAAILRITNKKKATSSLPKKRPAETPRNNATKTPGARVRLGLSQSRRVVSSQAVLDSSDDDDFDVAKSQPRNNATKTPGARVRLSLSQSRRVVSSQAIIDSSDDDFDVAKSQPGFPMAKKKRGNSRTQISSNHVATPKKVVSSKRKPGSSAAKRIIHAMSDSDSDSDFDMEKSLPLPKPKSTQEACKNAAPMRRSHTQPLPKGAYAAAECEEKNVLRVTPMRRLIKEVLAKVKAELHPEGHNPMAADRVTGDALDALCRGAEQHLQEMFELGVIATQHTGRTTIKPEDIRAAEKMKMKVVLNRGFDW